MDIRRITDNYAVAPQIDVDDIPAIKDAGFKSIVCNRPDDEQPDHPAYGTIMAVAEEAGLAFRYIPVVSGAITQENVEEQAAALRDMPRPVLAYCRSGTRCANLYGMIEGK